jgi:hypothetical protein
MSNLSPLGLTRDSRALYLLALAALVGFLATMPPPTQWTYSQWMQAAAGALAWAIGKMQTSPLKGDQP